MIKELDSTIKEPKEKKFEVKTISFPKDLLPSWQSLKDKSGTVQLILRLNIEYQKLGKNSTDLDAWLRQKLVDMKRDYKEWLENSESVWGWFAILVLGGGLPFT